MTDTPLLHRLREGEWRPTHRHLKSGREYMKLAEGRIELDQTPVVIYLARDGTVWVRPTENFNDGRFALITAKETEHAKE